MLEGSCIPPNLVSVANDQESFIEALNLLLEKEFKAQEIAKRDEVLTNFFSNVKNALILDSRIQATK
jgi:FixJ family two-component response regulator